MDGSRFRVVLLLILTFAAGAAAGVAADRLELLPGFARADETEDVAERAGEDGDRRGRETTIERFADELGLSQAQRTEIDGILERYRASMREIWQDVRPRYRSLVDSVRTRIEGVLTPEQVTAYRSLLERRRGDRDEDGRSSGDRRNDGTDGGDRGRSDDDGK